MPGGRCVVYICKNYVKMPKALRNDVTFHKFPKEPALRKRWLKWCRSNGKWNPDYAFVCSLHFTEDDYVRDLKGELLGCTSRKRLKPGAVPSVNLSFSGESKRKSPISRNELMNLSGDLNKAKKKIENHRKLIHERLNASVGVKLDYTQKKSMINSQNNTMSGNFNRRTATNTEKFRKNAIINNFNTHQASIIYVSSGSLTDCWVPKSIFVPSMVKHVLEKDGSSSKIENTVKENSAGSESKESSILYELLNSGSNEDCNMLHGKKILWQYSGHHKKPRLVLPVVMKKSSEEYSTSLNGNFGAINADSYRNQAFIQSETTQSVKVVEISNTDQEENMDRTSDHNYVKTSSEVTSTAVSTSTSNSYLPPENTALILDETDIGYTEVIDETAINQEGTNGINRNKGKATSLIVKVKSLEAQVSRQKTVIKRLRHRIKQDERLIQQYLQKEENGDLTTLGKFNTTKNYA